MSVCKHMRKDGICGLHSEQFYKETCHEGPCTDYAAMTNADKIRHMSDEELAYFIARERFSAVNTIADKLDIDVTTAFITSQKNALNWLKKKVEDVSR